MADFNIRSESVDVEQIMGQIRARIREKRGVDYTEDQIRELATVRLEKFLDPKNLRSDLLDQFRRSRPAIPAEPPPVEPPYTFTAETLYETHRGSLRFIRKLLHPILKLLFNPNPLITAMHKQVEFNVDLLKREQRRRIEFERSRSEWNALYYEVLHNLVLETTRNGIELKNMKMRLEALASRLDFSERRVRALEGVVQYRPEIVRRDRDRVRERPPHQDTNAVALEGETAMAPDAEPGVLSAGPGNPVTSGGTPGDPASRRRRRRRRGRRGASPGSITVAGSESPQASGDEVPAAGDDGLDEGDEMEIASAPFDEAQDRPFDDAQGTPFDDAQGEPVDEAQGKPFDEAQGRPFDEAQGRPFDDAQGEPFDKAEGREHQPHDRPETPSDPEQQ